MGTFRPKAVKMKRNKRYLYVFTHLKPGSYIREEKRAVIVSDNPKRDVTSRMRAYKYPELVSITEVPWGAAKSSMEIVGVSSVLARARAEQSPDTAQTA